MITKMKLMFLAFATLVAANVAFGDYTYQALFWQVDDTADHYGSDTFAALYATIGADTVCIDARELETAKGQVKSEFVPAFGTYDFSSASFYVELLNGSGDVLALSTSAPIYAALTDFMERNYSGSGDPGYTSSVYTYSFAIPEPTSGVLIWLGIAGLALRRKRRA